MMSHCLSRDIVIPAGTPLGPTNRTRPAKDHEAIVGIGGGIGFLSLTLDEAMAAGLVRQEEGE